MILTKHSKKKKEPKVSKHIFESKMKVIDKDIKLQEKKLTLTQKTLYFLSLNIVNQSLILMNLSIVTFILKEFISNYIIKERMKKENSEVELILVKLQVKTIEVDKNIQRYILMKTGIFHKK